MPDHPCLGLSMVCILTEMHQGSALGPWLPIADELFGPVHDDIS